MNINYYDKYLKYKMKYSNLKKINKNLVGGVYDKTEGKNIILFMFLGGLPNETSEVAQHWKKIFECSKNRDRFYAVVHPMQLANTTITPFWKNLFNNNILVVDNNHHVGTKWATRSLVDATLLMMQYARSNINNIKKYVLLSSSCAPLFNLDDLYYAFNRDNKSWLQSQSEEEGIRKHLKYTLENSGGLFGLYESNYFSQWMAIDKIHADYFFINSVDRTYIVQVNETNDKVTYCGQTNKVIINDTIPNSNKKEELMLLLSSFESTIYGEINSLEELYQPCVATDEHFFGMFIYYKLFQNENINDYLTILHNNIITQTFARIVQKVKYFKKYSNELAVLFYRNNQNNFSTINNNENYNKNVFTIMNEGHHIYTPNGNYSLNLSKKESIKYSTNVNILGHNRVFLNNFNQNINIEDTNLNNEKIGFAPNIKSEFYPVSCTYTDWDSWSPDPRNVLRSLKINNDFNLNGFLNLSPSEALQYLSNIDNKPNSFWELEIKMPMYHPLEYTEWSLNDVINAYIIIGFLKELMIQPENSWPQHIFKWAYEEYKNIICHHFNNWEENILNISDDVDIPFLECLNYDILNNYNFNEIKIGNYIYPETLVSAISSGALFIRKSANGCGISKYSDWICNSLNMKDMEKCLPETDDCCVIRGNINNDNNGSVGSFGTYRPSGSSGPGGSSGTSGSSGPRGTGGLSEPVGPKKHDGTSRLSGTSGPDGTSGPKNDIFNIINKIQTINIQNTVINNGNNFKKLLETLLFINKFSIKKNYNLNNSTIGLKEIIPKQEKIKLSSAKNYIEWDYIDYFTQTIPSAKDNKYKLILDEFKKWIFDKKLVKIIKINDSLKLEFIDYKIKDIVFKYLFKDKESALEYYKKYNSETK